MNWQPIRTAPKNEIVWITFERDGKRYVTDCFYPFLDGTLAWQPIGKVRKWPKQPYYGAAKDLPESTTPADPCGANVDNSVRMDALTRPSVLYRPALSIDGNMWCALYGANPQDGVAGFGKSPALAMNDFDRAWFASLEAAR